MEAISLDSALDAASSPNNNNGHRCIDKRVFPAVGYRHKRDNEPKARDLTLEQLTRMLISHTEQAQKDAPECRRYPEP
jgi:hypothetical protein